MTHAATLSTASVPRIDQDEIWDKKYTTEYYITSFNKFTDRGVLCSLGVLVPLCRFELEFAMLHVASFDQPSGDTRTALTYSELNDVNSLLTAFSSFLRPSDPFIHLVHFSSNSSYRYLGLTHWVLL